MTSSSTVQVIEVRALQKSYGELNAVRGLDLTIVRGEIFAILGPNGAGKTTTVEILEGFRPRSSGSVAVLGTDPARGDRRWRARLGIVLQDGADKPELTVSEMVGHFARYYPAPRDPQEAIDLVGLREKAGARIRTLSGGQRRRLEIALAIVGRPELLFLDEPTTGFDPVARRAFWDLIRAIRGEGATILLTTHYLDEAAALADRVAVIDRGRVIALDTPDRLGGDLRHQAIVRWTEGGRAVEERTADPTAIVVALAERMRAAGHVQIPDLTVTRPTLEDVYLELLAEPTTSAAETTAATSVGDSR